MIKKPTNQINVIPSGHVLISYELAVNIDTHHCHPSWKLNNIFVYFPKVQNYSFLNAKCFTMHYCHNIYKKLSLLFKKSLQFKIEVATDVTYSSDIPTNITVPV